VGTDQVSSDRPWYRRRLVIGCALVLLLLCLAVAALVGIGAWQREQVKSRVKEAVRASFPGFCDGAGERIRVGPRSMPPSPFSLRYWDVQCEPEAWMMGAAMTVDLETCTVSVPINQSIEGAHKYNQLYEPGQKIRCP
jgi:hypothetical protein